MHAKLILRPIGKYGDVYDRHGRQRRSLGVPAASVASSDVGECILLFGAFCNGEYIVRWQCHINTLRMHEDHTF